MQSLTNLELFERWYVWSIKFKDCDPAIWMTNYIFDRFKFNQEQKLWLCWLYGNTYHFPTAYLLWNEFPDYELVTVDRLEKWNTENYKRLRYQTDTKWSKGHLPKMFESYKAMIGPHKTQSDFFRRYNGDFHKLWETVNEKQYKFGRYSTWFYMQSLHMCCGIDLRPGSLMFSDYEGSRSHRNGWIYAVGPDTWLDKKLTTELYAGLESQAATFLHNLKKKYPEIQEEINPYTMETCLCSFKKIFRKNQSRYLGYYLDRQAEEIMQIEKDGWYGIDWNVLWQARDETLDPRLTGRNKIRKELFGEYVETKNLSRIDWLYPEMKKPVGLEAFI